MSGGTYGLELVCGLEEFPIGSWLSPTSYLQSGHSQGLGLQIRLPTLPKRSTSPRPPWYLRSSIDSQALDHDTSFRFGWTHLSKFEFAGYYSLECASAEAGGQQLYVRQFAG